MKLDGKVAIVTGGGQGIGRTIALAFAREGADVAIYDANLESAKEVATEIRSLMRQALSIKCDVSNKDEVIQATKEVLNNFKKIDILVNNAGLGPSSSAHEPAQAEEMTEATWDRTINVNLKGQFLCSQVIGREMIKQRHGKIINIASLAGHAAKPYIAAYAASKGGVLQLTKALAVEWAKYNINVNAVSPGMVLDTSTNKKASRKDPNLVMSRVMRIPLRRQILPEDIASAVLFLSSMESDNITGQTIIVDGGSLALSSSYI